MSELLARLAHRGEGHGCSSSELDVVVADDGEIIWYTVTTANRLLKQAERQEIVGAERRGRPPRCWQTCEAFASATALCDAERVGCDGNEVVGVQTRGRERVERSVKAIANLADFKRSANERDLSVADVDEVLDCESSAEHVVDGDSAEILGVGGAIDDQQRGTSLGRRTESLVVGIDRSDQDAVDTLLDEEIEVCRLALIADRHRTLGSGLEDWNGIERLKPPATIA